MTVETAYTKTPLGIIKIVGNAKGVEEVTILDTVADALLTQPIPEGIQNVVSQLQEYFEGTRTQFDLVLQPQGTDFQQRVWEQLLTIPYGATTTYLDIAKQLGDPKCIRAAASANGKNPLGILIPCHRVIGSDGSLTGYAGGLWRKKWLLEHESPVKQQSLF
ncbi:methylated-DNA--[protein]-cysteine S-methyltransferase [Aquimarina brevivitae]|uniref:Methylated-DNA--protein-cysteine methyltransferase n=1 Tax=Aquimarina brevivitae TaxID=323412 RepID=A0A4Q7PF78_9FLAO|nr:methylated-DNA--[protein]-cysteine S-methyltransferase [Aquimarina brevivitae]RZS99133.1 methylated-DNA-[protein]-cysteine S-methyltransferase [Aquimarina brevivitae]